MDSEHKGKISKHSVTKIVASAAILVDVSGFTRTSNNIFTKSNDDSLLAFLQAWSEFRNAYVASLSSYGIQPAYPANRMGDGFITLLFGNFQLTKRVLHLLWKINRSLDLLRDQVQPFIQQGITGFTGLKAAAVFYPIVYETRLPESLVGKKTLDPKDYISPHFNLLARMLQFWHEDFPPNSIIVPGTAPAFPDAYGVTRRPLHHSLEGLLERMKGFAPEAIERFLGPNGVDLVTMESNPWE
jgi:hypothetical protein